MLNSLVLCPSALRSNTCTKSNLKICFLLICFHQMLPCTSFRYNKKIKKSYWTTVANTSPYASVHSSCAHLKTWKCQISVDTPPSPFPPTTPPPPPPVPGANRWYMHYNIYPILLLPSTRRFILDFFSPFLSFAQALPWFSWNLFSHHPTLDSLVLAEPLWF